MKMRWGTTCHDCHGNGGFYTAPDGTSWVSDPEDGRKMVWSRCEMCNGSGRVGDVMDDDDNTEN